MGLNKRDVSTLLSEAFAEQIFVHVRDARVVSGCERMPLLTQARSTAGDRLCPLVSGCRAACMLIRTLPTSLCDRAPASRTSHNWCCWTTASTGEPTL